MFDVHVCNCMSMVSLLCVHKTFTPYACSLAALCSIGKYEGDFIAWQAFGEGQLHAVQQDRDG